MAKLKAYQLRNKTPEELLKDLEQLRAELAKLRVAQVNRQASASKLAQIKVVRRNIARVLTVQSQRLRDAQRKLPIRNRVKDARPKRTKAIRLALKPSEKRPTLRQLKRNFYFPRNLKIAIKA